MKDIDMKINNSQQQRYSPNFGVLKSVKCLNSQNKKRCCSYWENIIAKEVKSLASENNFFIKNDVEASVRVQKYADAMLMLKCKPAAKSFLDKIKNLFVTPQKYKLIDNHNCVDESSYFLSRKIREMKGKSEDAFLDVLNKVYVENN